MKKVIAAALALGLGAAFCLPIAACGGTGYTVTVLDPSGKAYEGAQVRLSELGEQVRAYGPVTSGQDGVAKFDLPDAGKTLDADLLTVPAEWTYDPVTVKEGGSATIKLKTVAAAEPTGGTGYGQLKVDAFAGNSTIDNSSFDPYRVGAGAYTFKFDSADEKIYLAFSVGRVSEFTVFSSGDADVNLNRLFGSLPGTIYKYGNEYFYDNISETDKNFRYAFNYTDSDLQTPGGGALYFELGLSDSADVNKEFTVTFKYERKHVVEPPEYTPEIVAVKENFKTFDPPAGKSIVQFIDKAFVVPETEPVLGKDGYYHIGSEDGELLYALIKSPLSPYNLDSGFDGIAAAWGGNFSFSDGKTFSRDYLNFINAYVEHANSDGVYPLTEEFKRFLTDYLTYKLDVTEIEDALYKNIPPDYPWIAACGYYA